jgi:hypothetical protein
MMHRPIRHVVPRLLAGLLLLGSQFYSAWAMDPDQGGGIGGTGITGMGAVQRFGSIYVNGREYFLTPDTRITEDGNTLRESDLHLGDVVIVQGRVEAGSGRSVAARVAVEQALRGQVDNVNVGSGTLTVLGQVVHVGRDTFDGSPENKPLKLEKVHVGDTVAVSGLLRADGTWAATRVQSFMRSVAQRDAWLLRGNLRAVDRVRGSLTVGAGSVHIDAARIPTNLAAGQAVRITGHYRQGKPYANNVRVERLDLGVAGTRLELSGYIQSQPAAGTATCNGVLLYYGTDTEFAGGRAADLARDMPIAVHGTLRPDGGISVERMVLHAEFLRVEMPLPRMEPPQRRMDPAEIHRPEVPSMRPMIERPMPERPMMDRPFTRN